MSSPTGGKLVPGGGQPPPLVQYGKWYHIRNHYVRPNGKQLYLDSNGGAVGCGENYLDVSLSEEMDREGSHSGVWRFIYAETGWNPGVQPSESVRVLDRFYLQNAYGDRGYLDVCGDALGCKGESQRDVSLSRKKDRYPGSAIWFASLSLEWKQMYLRERDQVGIQSQYRGEKDPPGFAYLGACGKPERSNGAFDVSTSSKQDRDPGSGMWSAVPYHGLDIRE
jgi:hypothetical protein